MTRVDGDTVVFTTETFGYGAPGQLLPVVSKLQHLREDGLRFVGVGGGGLRKLTEGVDYFDRVLPNDDAELTREVIDTLETNVDRIRALYTVSEPRTAMWANKWEVPNVINYEGLFPFWQVSDVDTLRGQRDEFQAIGAHDTGAILEFADRLDAAGQHHDLQMSPIYASSINFVLRGFGAAERMDLFLQHGLFSREGLVNVGAVVTEPNIPEMGEDSKRHLYIQINGAHYPIYEPHHHQTYMDFIFTLLDVALREVDRSLQVTVVCHEKYHELESARGLRDRTSFSDSLNPQENANRIAQHRVVLSPPGRMTMYDSAAARVPMISLPAKHSEQHETLAELDAFGLRLPQRLQQRPARSAGSDIRAELAAFGLEAPPPPVERPAPDIRAELAAFGYQMPSATISRSNGYVALDRPEFEESRALIEEYERLLASPREMERLGRLLAQEITGVLDDPELHAEGLRAVCSEVVGDFDGAQTIATAVEEVLVAA